MYQKPDFRRFDETSEYSGRQPSKQVPDVGFRTQPDFISRSTSSPAREVEKNTPFDFLSDVGADLIEIVHSTIQSTLPGSAKDRIISMAISQGGFDVNRYEIWKKEMATKNPKFLEKQLPNVKDRSTVEWLMEKEMFDEAIKVCEKISANACNAMIEWKQQITSKTMWADAVFNEASQILGLWKTDRNEDKGDKEELAARCQRKPTVEYKDSYHPVVEEAYPSPETFIPEIYGNHRTHLSSSKQQPLAISEEAFNFFDLEDNSDKHAILECPPRQAHDSHTAISFPLQRTKSKSYAGMVQKNEEHLTTNILLLGETGAGKTTFINGFANYTSNKTLENALNGNFKIVVDACFSTTDKNSQAVTVTARCDNRRHKENEVLGCAGKSSTQKTMDHVFRWMENGEEQIVRIIDTPGMNDTRGTEQDDQNFQNIMDHIAKIEKLHAICFVMKPNESKFTVAFRYCLENLVTKLHRKATSNIIFCFTNTRSNQYRPADSLTTLTEYLKHLEHDTGVLIQANKSNIFCFDNDCFRYVCTKKQHRHLYEPKSEEAFSGGWLHNVRETALMIKRVKGLIAHDVMDTVSINKTRRVIAELARPLAEIARNNVMNVALIEAQNAKIIEMAQQGHSLKEHIYKRQVVLVTVPLQHPRTVCTAPTCVTYESIGGVKHMVPKKICHDKCTLHVKTETVANYSLSGCSAFIDEMCKTCSCHWKKHMHTTYDVQRQEEKVVDYTLMSRMLQCQDTRKAAEVALQEKTKEIEELLTEQDLIRDCCAEMAAFLWINSIKNSADPYAEYLRFMLEDETNKVELGGSDKVLIELVEMLDKYETRVKYIMDEIKNQRKSPLTLTELNKMVLNLTKLKVSGPAIHSMWKHHKSAVRQQTTSAV